MQRVREQWLKSGQGTFHSCVVNAESTETNQSKQHEKGTCEFGQALHKRLVRKVEKICGKFMENQSKKTWEPFHRHDLLFVLGNALTAKTACRAALLVPERLDGKNIILLVLKLCVSTLRLWQRKTCGKLRKDLGETVSGFCANLVQFFGKSARDFGRKVGGNAPRF